MSRRPPASSSWEVATKGTIQKALGLILVGLWAFPAAAQTVRPVVVEYKGKAASRFEVVNRSDFPVQVILEARSFDVTLEGKPVFRPLDDHIQLKLSSMSFRIPPRGSHYVFYKATTDALPAWFVIYSTFRGLRTPEGMNLAIELPHTVYLLQKEPLGREDVRLSSAEFLPGEKKLVVELENPSERLGRVLTVNLGGGQNRQTIGGFPLMPAGRRRIVVDWTQAGTPGKVEVRFRKFTLKKEVLVRSSGQ